MNATGIIVCRPAAIDIDQPPMLTTFSIHIPIHPPSLLLVTRASLLEDGTHGSCCISEKADLTLALLPKVRASDRGLRKNETPPEMAVSAAMISTAH